MPVKSLELQTSILHAAGKDHEVDARYKPIDSMNFARTDTYTAEDIASGELVAIKRVRGILDSSTTAKISLRELRLLRLLQHENIMEVTSIFFNGLKSDFKDLFVVSNPVETDLAAILQSTHPLTPDHKCYITYQILRGMKYVHSAKVVHGDLQPQYVLINCSCDVRISGFGLHPVSSTAKQWLWTESGRHYCAPEVLGCGNKLSCPLDLWSIACIHAEMHLRRPLFPSGSRLQHVVMLIRLLGLPCNNDHVDIKCSLCLNAIKSYKSPPGSSASAQECLRDLLPEARQSEQDFMFKMLRWDANRRYTADQAIQHPYMVHLYDPEDEPTRGPLDLREFEFEVQKATRQELREEVFREALQYYPELLDKYSRERRAEAPLVARMRQLSRGIQQSIDHAVLLDEVTIEDALNLAVAMLVQKPEA